MRAATCSYVDLERVSWSSSSVSPSEKYSCSLSPLRFTNGSTARECGGGAKAVGVTLAGATGVVGCDAWCFETESLSMAK